MEASNESVLVAGASEDSGSFIDVRPADSRSPVAAVEVSEVA